MGRGTLNAKLFKKWKEIRSEEDGDAPESYSIKDINRVLSTSSE